MYFPRNWLVMMLIFIQHFLTRQKIQKPSRIELFKHMKHGWMQVMLKCQVMLLRNHLHHMDEYDRMQVNQPDRHEQRCVGAVEESSVVEVVLIGPILMELTLTSRHFQLLNQTKHPAQTQFHLLISNRDLEANHQIPVWIRKHFNQAMNRLD